MRVALTVLIAVMVSCEKHAKIEDPHFKELVGTWSTVSDSEPQSIVVADDGKITVDGGRSLFIKIK